VFQRNLLEAPQRDKLDKILKTADKLRERFGFEAVQLARSIETGKEQKARKRRDFLGREGR
jgi:biotin synthase-like enzyme